MSEPITRADFAKWLIFCGDLETHAMFEDWCARNPAESAPPPRVPVSSAQPDREGVKSGPGQPTDIVEHLDARARWHDSIGSSKAAADCRQAVAEIRRLRATLLEAQAALPQAARSSRAEGYRVGIVAAAEWHDQLASRLDPDYVTDRPTREAHADYANRIRALADKPAPSGKGG